MEGVLSCFGGVCFGGDLGALAGLLATISYFSPSLEGEICTATTGRSLCSGAGGDLSRVESLHQILVSIITLERNKFIYCINYQKSNNGMAIDPTIDLRSPSPKVGDFLGVRRRSPFPLSGELTLMPLPKDLPAGEHTLKVRAVAAADGDFGGVPDRVITLKSGFT